GHTIQRPATKEHSAAAETDCQPARSAWMQGGRLAWDDRNVTPASPLVCRLGSSRPVGVPFG
ncbi:MAG: hypothetical protein FWG16_07800, partial [Micrococcales bacterium]|nr:hypothetical protein [Micrococcales bacterium]